MENIQTFENIVKRIPWEQDEILLFLNIFGDEILKIKGKRKKELLTKSSKLLQARGRKLGYEIYENYRNVRSMENLFYSAKHYLQTGDPSNVHPLIVECVDFFQADRSAFDEAVAKIPSFTEEEKQKNVQPSMQQKIGNYGAIFKLCEISKSKRKILQMLRKNYADISDFKLEDSEKRSWESSIETLRQAYKSIGLTFGDLDVIMEFVLPRFKPGSKKALKEHSIRADVLIISEKTVLVLEFKQRNTNFEEGFVMQAGKYQTRLTRYHSASQNMIVKSILVLTKAENHIAAFGTVASCSADKLGDAITLMFEPNPKPYPNIMEWIRSDFQAELS